MFAAAICLIALSRQSNSSFTSHSTFDEAAVLKSLRVTERQFTQMRDEVSSWVYWDKEIENLDSKATDWKMRLTLISDRLRLISDTYCKQAHIAESSKLLRQWLFSEVVCAYICSRLTYDFDAGSKPIPVRNREAETDLVLAQPYSKRKTMCVGFVLLARDIIRTGGSNLDIGAYFVGSFDRTLGGSTTDVSNHAFLGLVLDGGLLVGAELVTPRLTLKEFKARSTAPRFDFVMPFTQAERELFLARNYAADETLEGQTNHGNPQNYLKFSSLSLAEWKTRATTHLAPLDKAATKDFDNRAKWVQVD